LRLTVRKADNTKKGQVGAIKTIGSCEEQQKLFDWHIGIEDELVSHISRRSIDTLKEHHRKDLSLKRRFSG